MKTNNLSHQIQIASRIDGELQLGQRRWRRTADHLGIVRRVILRAVARAYDEPAARIVVHGATGVRAHGVVGNELIAGGMDHDGGITRLRIGYHAR